MAVLVHKHFAGCKFIHAQGSYGPEQLTHGTGCGSGFVGPFYLTCIRICMKYSMNQEEKYL